MAQRAIKYLTVQVDAEDHRRFRTATTARGITMSDRIRSLMSRDVAWAERAGLRLPGDDRADKTQDGGGE